MTQLLLIRHGQIQANRKGLWHGSTDSPLTWIGRWQAHKTSRHVGKKFPLTAVYASPLQRCRHTAAAIAKRAGHSVVVHDDLREYAIGEWEGMPHRELQKQHRFIDLSTENHDFAPPGGETLGGVAKRVTDALREIAGRHGPDERVAVVSHGAALGVALGTLLDNDPGRWTQYQFANCSLTELVLSPAPYVNFFNQTFHL